MLEVLSGQDRLKAEKRVSRAVEVNVKYLSYSFHFLRTLQKMGECEEEFESRCHLCVGGKFPPHLNNRRGRRHVLFFVFIRTCKQLC